MHTYYDSQVVTIGGQLLDKSIFPNHCSSGILGYFHLGSSVVDRRRDEERCKSLLPPEEPGAPLADIALRDRSSRPIPPRPTEDKSTLPLLLLEGCVRTDCSTHCSTH